MATPAQIRRRGRLGVVIGGVIAALALAAVASADDIGNKLDATVDATAEVMPLNAGGAAGSTQLFVTPTGGDGKSGCNLTGSTTLVLSVASTDTSVATVSPASVTFTSCGATPTLTVTPHAQGSATIAVAQVSNTTDGTFNLAPATFTVTVAAPASVNTAPSVSVDGVSGGASYAKGAVPVATCQVTDAEDGSSSFAAMLSAVSGPYAADSIGSQTASCSYTDSGGLTASASETYAVVDASAPTIDYALSPASPDGADGWYRGDVTLTWMVGDAESPFSLAKIGCVDQTDVADQPETVYSCSATSAGGSSGPVTVSIKRDGTVPTVLCGTADALWHADDVVITCTASDALSLLLHAADASFVLTTNVVEGTETAAAATDDRTVADNAGNVANAGPIGGLKIDKKAPDVDCDAADGDWHASNVAVACTAADGGSGLADAADSSFTLVTSVPVGTETSDAATDARTVSDAVGNAADARPVVGNRIDRKGPSVTAACPDTVLLGAGAAANWTASDGGSGVAAGHENGTVAGLDTASVGTKTATVPAGASEDAVANASAAAACTYAVIYRWAGFFQPVDNLATLNAVKAGGAVPVKF